MSTEMLATIVVPTYNRIAETERAIKSVIACAGADKVEILIVDDCSNIPFCSKLLRSQDRVVRLEKNSGGAIARNIGIKSAASDLVYLLDSDDVFLERDFINDANCIEKGFLYYCDMKIGGRVTTYPSEIVENQFLQHIFVSNEGIAQTSSLCFRKSELYFDESLPKHQDWDFVLFSALKSGIRVVKMSGLIELIKDDRNSESRKLIPELSDPWMKKILNTSLMSKDYRWINYHLFAKYPGRVGWFDFFSGSVVYVYQNKLSIVVAIKRCIQRLF
jgi:glycosyltransferase involved in cell wall biosynthesis